MREIRISVLLYRLICFAFSSMPLTLPRVKLSA
jgi:hypothetical protein